MYGKLVLGVAFAALFLLGSAALEAALPRRQETSIVTTGELCGGCVMKIISQFKGIAGVAAVRIELPTKTTVVTAAEGVILSPRTLWEGMEAAGMAPRSLVGPSGVYNSKPRG